MPLLSYCRDSCQESFPEFFDLLLILSIQSRFQQPPNDFENGNVEIFTKKAGHSEKSSGLCGRETWVQRPFLDSGKKAQFPQEHHNCTHLVNCDPGYEEVVLRKSRENMLLFKET